MVESETVTLQASHVFATSSGLRNRSLERLAPIVIRDCMLGVADGRAAKLAVINCG
jgi:hypothetical protein